MEWGQLFLEKEKWQRDTFNRIKNNLVCAKGNRFLRYEDSREEHLVIIYGKPQVGKTTLILSMIGIKDEFFEEVYDTLRAGITRGNSSTSTAIIYSRSDNDMYGCVLAPLDDIQSQRVNYCNKTEMTEELAKVRQDVESNRIKTNSILFVSIPNKYFIQDTSKEIISIMDMPGVGSRNHKEDIHLRNLLTRYIPISSVCIIVCRANDIVSLESLALPNEIDWKRLAHRFLLVITNAYSDGTTRNYFKKERQKREKGFYDYVKGEYTNEIRNILGSGNNTELYPIDIGGSLMRLCTNEIRDEEDRIEIVETKDRFLADLHDSIVAHKGEKLKSALMDLETMADRYRKDDAELIDKKIIQFREKISLIDEQKTRTTNNLKEIFPDVGDMDEFEGSCESAKEKIKEQIAEIKRRCSRCEAECFESVNGFNDRIIKYIDDNGLCRYDRTGGILTDKNKQLLMFIHKEIAYSVIRFNQTICKILEEAGLGAPDELALVSKIYDKSVAAYQVSLYPSQTGLFSPKRTVSLEIVNDICCHIQQDIYDSLEKYIRSCKRQLCDKADGLRRLEMIASTELRKLKEFPKDKKRYEQMIADLEKELEDISIKRDQDKKTLALYLEYAREAYLVQRDQTIRKINNCGSADEKLMLILFLGLLDKDYQKVIGGFDEDRS